MAIDGGGASIPVGHVSRTPLNAEAFPQVRRATQGVWGNKSPWVGGGVLPGLPNRTFRRPKSAYTQSFLRGVIIDGPYCPVDGTCI